MQSVCVIVVTHNRYSLLNRCLKSLSAQTHSKISIIVVDNASSDETPERMAIEWCQNNSHISYNYLKENLGGAGGFSYGMQLAFTQNCDWIMLMDDDAAPAENYIELLLASSKRNPECKCFIGSEFKGYTNQREYGGRRRITNPKFLIEGCIDEKEYRANKEFYIDSFTFVGVMIHESIAKLIGLPDSSFFIYYDDTDYSFRLKKYSKILCVSDAIIHHRTDHIEETSKELNSNWRRFYLFRNNLEIKRRYVIKKRYWLTYMLLSYIRRIMLCFISLVRKKNSLSDTVHKINYYTHAIIDVFRGKLGKADYTSIQ